MKKSPYVLVAILIISLVAPVHAQETYVGILGGFNFADMKLVFEDKSISNYDVQARTLFGVGGFFGLSLNEHMSVQLEPVYLQKGGIYTKPSMPDMSIKFSQLELQLLLKVGIGEQIRPYILAGPSVSYVLDASSEIEMAGRVFEGNLMEILKRTEYGAVFGAGVSVPVWKGSAFIEGCYSVGLSNVNKGGKFDLTSGSLTLPGPEAVPGDEIKAKGIQIMVGYQLPLGGE